MIGSIEGAKSFKKSTIVISILAGIVTGLLSTLKGMSWLYILALTGAGIFGFLLIYKYHWIGILNIFLLSMVKIEPAPSDILFVFLCIFGIIGDHLNFQRLMDSKAITFLPALYAIINTLQLFLYAIGR